jgi:secondary thiamine-phosphate synthase enzyme
MSVLKVEVPTAGHFEMVDITSRVRSAVRESGIKSGLCMVYVPHTTAAVTINEHADPDVTADIIRTLDRLVPERNSYAHSEGNSQAHIKASIIGNSRVLFIENGAPLLGTWEGVFLCEFDGPRRRQVLVKVVNG